MEKARCRYLINSQTLFGRNCFCIQTEGSWPISINSQKYSQMKFLRKCLRALKQCILHQDMLSLELKLKYIIEKAFIIVFFFFTIKEGQPDDTRIYFLVKGEINLFLGSDRLRQARLINNLKVNRCSSLIFLKN